MNSLLTLFLGFAGTFVFALSGIELASKKQVDWFGAYLVGLVTAVGGGTIRDILLDVSPFWMQDSSYFTITGLALLATLLFKEKLKNFPDISNRIVEYSRFNNYHRSEESAIRPFLSIYAHAEEFDLNIPSELDILFQDKVYSSIIPIDFAVQSTSAGIMLGYQFRKGKWGVDWTIIGPRFGYASSLFAQANQSLLERLSDSEKEFVIDDIYAKYRLNKSYFQVNIDGTRAEIRNLKPIPIGIIRGFGLNIFRYF